jgi:hypothetical protein
VAALKSRPQRQQGRGRKGSIGGRRFGPGKRRHWCAVCGKGPRFFCASSSNPRAPGQENDRKRPWPHRPACATGDNTGARVDASQQNKGGGPWQKPGEVRAKSCTLRGARGSATAGARDTNCGATRGWKCLRAIQRQSGRPSLSSAQACWAKAGGRRGGQRGESRVLESRWAPGVLVDNKLVAEIW